MISFVKEDLEDHNSTARHKDLLFGYVSCVFISRITDQFPESSITFDKFHVMMMMNDAMDQVRREGLLSNAKLKRTRYIWLRIQTIFHLRKKKS